MLAVALLSNGVVPRNQFENGKSYDTIEEYLTQGFYDFLVYENPVIFEALVKGLDQKVINSILFHAIGFKDSTRVCMILIQNGADVHRRDKGEFALHKAASKGMTDLCLNLLSIPGTKYQRHEMNY